MDRSFLGVVRSLIHIFSAVSVCGFETSEVSETPLLIDLKVVCPHVVVSWHIFNGYECCRLGKTSRSLIIARIRKVMKKYINSFFPTKLKHTG